MYLLQILVIGPELLLPFRPTRVVCCKAFMLTYACISGREGWIGGESEVLIVMCREDFMTLFES